MKKKNLIYIISAICFFTMISIILGLIFDKSEKQKMNGLSEVYDVNQNGFIAFVSYDEGKPGIYVRTDKKEELAIQLEEDQNIYDLAFSNDGMSVLYTVSKENNSTVYLLDSRSYDSKEIFTDNAYITDIAFDPASENSFYYLKADTFENYSPIASEHPHEFDLYEYDLETEKEKQLTHFSKYSMGSLSISNKGDKAYVQMDDDFAADTADEIFATKQKIFEIPLENPENFKVISEKIPAEDIYDFAVMPDGEGIIYQAVSNFEKNETYQYELYYYDLEKGTAERLTNIKIYAGRPVIKSGGDTVYFIVNKGFATSKDDYYLYEINIDGGEAVHIPLGEERS